MADGAAPLPAGFVVAALTLCSDASATSSLAGLSPSWLLRGRGRSAPSLRVTQERAAWCAQAGHRDLSALPFPPPQELL